MKGWREGWGVQCTDVYRLGKLWEYMDGLDGNLLQSAMNFDTVQNLKPTRTLVGRRNHDELVENLKELLDWCTFHARFYFVQCTALLANHD